MDHPNTQEELKAPHVILIGGVDSSGGAGISADLRALDSLEVREKLFITCNTFQGPEGLKKVFPTDVLSFEQELGDHLEFYGKKPILKVGLIPNLDLAKSLVGLIKKFKARVVYDPVLSVSKGQQTLKEDHIEYIAENLLPLCELFTPNLNEASIIWNKPLEFWNNSLEVLNSFFKEKSLNSIYLKGGHAQGFSKAYVRDFYFSTGKSFFLFQDFLDLKVAQKTRGTGCFLASAIAGAMSLGLPLEDAVVLGKTQLTNALRNYKEGDYQFYLNPREISPHDFPWLGRGEKKSPEIEPFSPMDLDFNSTEFYPIVDRAHWIEKFGQWGVKMAQIRIKDLEGEELEKEIRTAVAFSHCYGLKLFVNDFWEFALKYQSFGVHLGQEDLEKEIPLQKIREAGIRLGVSTHSYEEASFAKGLGPSYVALGPVYFTKLKAMKFSPQGIGNLKRWRKLFDGPLVAIGGITLERWNEVKEGEPNIVSVVRDITQNPSPKERTLAWLKKTKESELNFPD